MTWTCTYAGLRQHAGREVAVILLEGDLSTGGDEEDDDSDGKASGTLLVDAATGQVVQADADFRLSFTMFVQGYPLPAQTWSTVRLEEDATALGKN